MRRSIYFLLSLTLLFSSLSSCKSSGDLDPNGPENPEIEGIVQFDIHQRMIMYGEDPNSAIFQANIVDINQAVSSYRLGLITNTDTVQVGAVHTSFPASLVVEATEIRDALGRDLESGESFEFFGEITLKSGRILSADKLDIYLNRSGGAESLLRSKSDLKQAVLFELTLACPETATIFTDLVGHWAIQTDGNYPSNQTPSIDGMVVGVVEGPEANQFVIQNLWANGRDFIVTHDPESDTLRSTEQEGWPHSHYGMILPQIVEGSVFVCTETIKFTTRHFLADGMAFSKSLSLTLTKL